jgi:hypothetical protein
MLIIFAALALESLSRPPSPGFVVGYQVARDGNLIIEQVPAGETVERWTRMVTTQRFAGAAQRLSANDLLQNMIDGLSGACPGAKVAYRRVNGRTAQMRVNCPRNPKTGLPETFFAKAMAGASDMHVAQVAFRRVPSATDVAWAEKYLTSVSLKP